MFCGNNYSFASNDFSLSSYLINHVNDKVFPCPDNKILFIDKNNVIGESLKMFDGDSNRIEWNKPIGRIFDLKIIDKKIVLITEKAGYIIKMVYDINGNFLHKNTLFKISKPSSYYEIKYLKESNKTKEKVVTKFNNSFIVYSYPWKKPEIIYKLNLTNNMEKFYKIQEWNMNYPYLVVKFMDGGAEVFDNFPIKVINIISKHETLIKYNTNRSYSFSLDNNNIIITSSESTRPPIQPDITKKQTFFYSYDLSTGKLVSSKNKIFTEGKDEDNTGWKTKIIYDQILVEDLGANKWDLYDLKGNILIKDMVNLDKNGKFIYFFKKEKQAYFLVLISDQFCSVKKVILN